MRFRLPLLTRCAPPLAIAALLLAAHPPREAAAQRSRSRVDSTFAFSRTGFVDLAVTAGEITVTGWTRPEARVIVWAESEPNDLQLSSGRITVSARRGRHVRVEVMLPVGTRIAATATSGDIRVSGTNGEVEAQASSGDIEVTDASDRVSITTISGTIHAARIRGRVRLNGTSADLDASEITGDLDAHTISGEVRLSRIVANQVRVETTSGNISYEGTMNATGSYEFQAHSGDIRLEVPPTVQASLQVQTYTGSITSRFPMLLQPGETTQARRGKKLNFTIGSGGARVTVETFSGDITIERAGRTGKEN